MHHDARRRVAPGAGSSHGSSIAFSIRVFTVSVFFLDILFNLPAADRGSGPSVLSRSRARSPCAAARGATIFAASAAHLDAMPFAAYRCPCAPAPCILNKIDGDVIKISFTSLLLINLFESSRRRIPHRSLRSSECVSASSARRRRTTRMAVSWLRIRFDIFLRELKWTFFNEKLAGRTDVRDTICSHVKVLFCPQDSRYRADWGPGTTRY